MAGLISVINKTHETAMSHRLERALISGVFEIRNQVGLVMDHILLGLSISLTELKSCIYLEGRF